MNVSLEPLKEEHFDSPSIICILRNLPPSSLLRLESTGGMAQAVNFDGKVVGVIIVTPDREAMIGIDPSYHGQGIGTAALSLAKSIAIARSISSVTASALIGRNSNRLLAKFGAYELSRTDSEIRYRIDFDTTEQTT